MDFASLTSANVRTTFAMQAMVSTFANQGAEYAHHRKFVLHHAEALAATKSPSFSPEPGEASSGITTEADRSDDEYVIPLHEAPCYVLSLERDKLPFRPDIGYMFGTGDRARFPYSAGVDLLLPPSSSATDIIYARQGYFAFDPKYGRFWLHARHRGIRVDDRPLSPNSKILLQTRVRISIGPYRFIFEFHVSDEGGFQTAKREHIAEHRGENNPFESTSVTPSTHDIRINDWVLHGVVGASAVSLIHAGSNMRSGEVVAVKRLQLSKMFKGDAKKEIKLYEDITESISAHPYSRFVMQKHSVLTNERPSQSHSEIYLLWKPLARGEFTEFGPLGRWSAQTRMSKLSLFVQSLCGLSALHDSGWIHRDLKPANIGVVELGEKPFAIIMDEGQAIRIEQDGHAPRAGHCGTIGFLAPELENDNIVPTYNKEVDIWSMGAVAYFLFDAGRIPWGFKFNIFLKEKAASEPLRLFREEQAKLLNKPAESLEYLIGQMLEEDPRQRPSMQAIFAHPAIEDVKKSIDEQLEAERQPGQKRAHE